MSFSVIVLSIIVYSFCGCIFGNPVTQVTPAPSLEGHTQQQPQKTAALAVEETSRPANTSGTSAQLNQQQPQSQGGTATGVGNCTGQGRCGVAQPQQQQQQQQPLQPQNQKSVSQQPLQPQNQQNVRHGPGLLDGSLGASQQVKGVSFGKPEDEYDPYGQGVQAPRWQELSDKDPELLFENITMPSHEKSEDEYDPYGPGVQALRWQELSDKDPELLFENITTPSHEKSEDEYDPYGPGVQALRWQELSDKDPELLFENITMPPITPTSYDIGNNTTILIFSGNTHTAGNEESPPGETTGFGIAEETTGAGEREETTEFGTLESTTETVIDQLSIM